MLNWIGKVLGGSSLDVPEGIPPQWAGRIDKLLEPVNESAGNKGRPGLSRDILDYVLNGESLSVLNEVGQRPAVGTQLRVLGHLYGQIPGESSTLYQEFDAVPTAVALRWARLLDACATSQHTWHRLQIPNGTHWAEALLLNSAGFSVTGWSSNRPKPRNITAAKIESLLVEDGLEASALLVGAFGTPVASGYGTERRLQIVVDLAGYADSLDRHVEAIRPLILPTQVPQRLHVLNLLETALPITLDKLAPELCELAVANSKQVRIAAEAVVRRCGSASFGPLRTFAIEGKPDQRVNALRLLAQFANERANSEIGSFAREAAAADKAPSVQALISEWESTVAAATADETKYEYAIPAIDWKSPANLPAAKLLDTFWHEVNDSIAKANKQAREHHERMRAKGHNFPLNQATAFGQSDVSALRAYLSSDEIRPPSRSSNRAAGWRHVTPSLKKLASTEGVTPVTVFKMLMFFDLAVGNDGVLLHPATEAFKSIHRRCERPSLLELSQMMDEAGFSGKGLFRTYCRGWGQSLGLDWSKEAVWPYFAHHLDTLVENLTQNLLKDYAFNRSGLFQAIATLPSPPALVVNALFSLALGTGKTDRLTAQDALANLPGKEARIINALTDGKSETRAIAAQWLGRLRHAPAIPALEKAVATEKFDLAKGAMLDALQLLGQPVEKYLNRDALAAEAKKSLGKGLPKDLEWFPWSALPEIRWGDTKAPVSAEILQWMIVQAVKQKLPEPNAVLRKYCAMFDPRDREQLGQFVLDAWLREDVRPIPPEDAMTRARAQAQSTHTYMAQSPQYFQNSPHLGKSVEELTAAFLPALLRLPQGSAIATKGLLAVAGACAAERAAAPTQRYLKEWYGSRAAQGKALIAMLAWIEHPSATQLMLAIGSRFRTKSFQEEATKQAEALADRKGWTLAELADRTVPSAGFDETGELALSYGERSFTARLLPDFSVELFNPDGKKIGSLPEPRQDDDAELAKEAKKAFSAAKKEIKSIVALQTDRLYEALCTEREWAYVDWATYLQQHPVLRHLVQRLVWVEIADGKVVRTFRPLDDGTLTDREDNEVRLPDEARVRVAHDSILDADEVAAWQQHLVDYEIKPLFQQLGKGRYTLPAAQAAADDIKDFQGYLIEAFALRGRALKLGYTRGPAEDGGWFHVYAKRFPTLGMEAIIEFTGNPLPEENRTVALMNLSFAGGGGSDATQRGKMPLCKVPKVLLSECYNDLRLIASEGTGFDADWQKKSEY